MKSKQQTGRSVTKLYCHRCIFRGKERYFPGNRTVGEVVGQHINQLSLSAASFFPSNFCFALLACTLSHSHTHTHNSNKLAFESVHVLIQKNLEIRCFQAHKHTKSNTTTHTHILRKSPVHKSLVHTHTQTLKHAAVCFGRVRH